MTQASHNCNQFTPVTSRREMLSTSATGFGMLALADLMSRQAAADATSRPINPLAPRDPHFPARAKRVIFLFMHGGPSHVDTFDHKPQLDKDHGKPLPFPKPRIVSGATGNLLKSPWAFKQHGQSGAWVSSVFPKIAEITDDLCFIKSMYGSNSRHGGALLELHTGSDTFIRPSMGSWLLYGLGSETENLPAYMVMTDPGGHPVDGIHNWSNGWMPTLFQGTVLRPKTPRILNLDAPPSVRGRVQEQNLSFLAKLNKRGRVAVRTELFLLKPVEARRGNGRVLFDVNKFKATLTSATVSPSP